MDIVPLEPRVANSERAGEASSAGSWSPSSCGDRQLLLTFGQAIALDDLAVEIQSGIAP